MPRLRMEMIRGNGVTVQTNMSGKSDSFTRSMRGLFYFYQIDPKRINNVSLSYKRTITVRYGAC